MQEPGVDEHIWISEWEQLSPFLQESPVEAIPEVYRLNYGPTAGTPA